MLVISRKVGEAIVIGEGDTRVDLVVKEIRGDTVRIGLDADRELVPILRQELEQEEKADGMS